jgi:hypothetical protein
MGIPYFAVGTKKLPVGGSDIDLSLLAPNPVYPLVKHSPGGGNPLNG